MFSLENAFELVIIGMALVHSRFARLPILVAVNIILYGVISTAINSTFDTTVSWGHEVYYLVTGGYFMCMAWLFSRVKNPYYLIIAICLLVQSIASVIIPVADMAQILYVHETTVFVYTESLYSWHEFVNSKVLVIECICVWLSALRCRNA